MNRVLLAIAWCAVSSAAAAQTDPRGAFINALGTFSLATRGEFGDEGPRLKSSLAAMRRALEAWDAQVAASERAMAAERRTAGPDLASRLHVALGAAYLDRGRAADALREFEAGATLAPRRADVHVFEALARQALAQPTIGALGQAAGLNGADPAVAYQHGRALLASNPSAAARELQRFVALAESRDATTTAAPLVPQTGLVAEVPGIEPFFPPAAYATGFARLRAGDYHSALEAFDAAVDQDPLAAEPTAETGSLVRAGTALREGSIETAIQSLQLAIELAPDRAEPRRVLGQAYLQNGEHDQALAEFDAARRLSPSDERVRLAMAAAHVRADRLDAAATALTETIAAVPASSQARYELALVHQRAGRYAEAISLLEQSLTYGPLLGANSVYQTIGALHRAQPSLDRAADAFARRLALVPNDARAHHELGDVLLALGRHEEALAEFMAAVMLDPSAASSHAGGAQVHLREGRHAEAAAAARRVIGLDPMHKEARYVLATSLIRLGRDEEGRRELDVFQRYQADDAAARDRAFERGALGREAAMRMASGDFGTAVVLLQKIVDADPAAAQPLMDLGLALAASGRHAEAVALLERARDRGAPLDVHRHLASAYDALGRETDGRRERARYQQLRRDALRQSAGLP